MNCNIGGVQSLYFDYGAAGQRGPSDRLTHATETYVRTLVQYVVRKQGAHTLTHAHRRACGRGERVGRVLVSGGREEGGAAWFLDLATFNIDVRIVVPTYRRVSILRRGKQQ